MTLLDRTKALCKAQGIKISELEREIGLSRGAIHKWKEHMPGGDVLRKAAAYLNVDLNYLLTGEDENSTSAENYDVAKELEHLLADLENSTLSLTFFGTPLSAPMRAMLKINLESSLEIAKIGSRYITGS